MQPLKQEGMNTALRLRLLPEDVAGFLADPRLNGVNLAQQHQLSAYYDTDDLVLRRHGYQLSTRCLGGDWMQIFRTSGSDGGKPLEWIQESQSEELDRSKLPVHGKVAVRLAKILADKPLQRVFTIDLQSSRQQCSPNPEATIQLTLDRREIRTDERSEPVQELSLSLLQGEPADFYAWVINLAEDRALIWETNDPVSRGYDLYLATPVTHYKAGAVALAGQCSSEDAFVVILNACLVQLQRNLPAAREGQIEGIHQMRVALRRLRSLLKIFRPLIPREASAELVAELRWINGFLGPARDWDVFLGEGLAPLFEHFPDKQGLRSLRAKSELIRSAHRQSLFRCLDEARYHRLILSLQGWFGCRSWRQNLSAIQLEALQQPVIEFATALLARDHRRVRKRGKKFASLSMQERHALRIRIKELRYALEFFASLYHGERVAAYVKATAGLQDNLGVLNDMVVAARLLDEAELNQATLTRHLIEGWYACNQYHHEQSFIENWERFVSCKLPWK